MTLPQRPTTDARSTGSATGARSLNESERVTPGVGAPGVFTPDGYIRRDAHPMLWRLPYGLSEQELLDAYKAPEAP